jgi:3-hydroxybutyryl-CoA dehydrogenase
MTEISRVAVIGGGLMGAGIAQVFATAGIPVSVFEPVPEVRNSLFERITANLRLVGSVETAVGLITAASNLPEAVANAQFITEAAPEKLELKQSIFAQLEEHAPETAILATNTSVIPVQHIAGSLASTHRVVGTHWWNPPYLVPLVEVVQAPRTSAHTLQRTMELLRNVGKSPAHVKKDTPGFVANRLQHALWREAIAMVAEGICDAATLDQCVKQSFGLRLAVLGPLENADLVGLDLTLDIHRTMIPALDRHDAPHEYLLGKVNEGRLGFKTGEGFRTWSTEQMKALREELIRHLVAMRA